MRKVFLIVGIVAALAGIYFFLIAPGAEDEVRSTSEAVVSAEEDLIVTANGVEVSIPVGALPPSTEVSVREATSVETTNEMRLSGAFASLVYNIESSSESSSEPVEISLEFDPALVSDGSMAIAAYWNGEIWVHVAGTIEGNTITVETDHFSFWVVLAVRWAYNELTDWVYDACTAFFAPEEDKWTVEYDNWLQIQGSLDTFLGELPEVDSISVTGNTPLASIIVDGSTYSIVETSLPAYLSSGNYSQSSNQLGVIDSRDRLVNDPEILFKTLYAYRLREYLGRIDLNAQADQLEESFSSLGTMHFWHRAISGTDIVQSLLSKILVHVSTHTVPSPAELLNPEILFAVEGIICRSEMTRFADDMMSLSDDFRSCDPAQMSYEELSSLACRSEGTLYRIDALTAFMRGTCPGLEANWFVYTAKKVLSDYLSIFIQKEAAHLAHTATHLINFDGALYAAKLSTLYQIAGSSGNIKGVFDLLVHTFNTNGSNPMVEYYNAIQRPTNELSSTDHSSFSILIECAYLVEMMNSFTPEGFPLMVLGSIIQISPDTKRVDLQARLESVIGQSASISTERNGFGFSYHDPAIPGHMQNLFITFDDDNNVSRVTSGWSYEEEQNRVGIYLHHWLLENAGQPQLASPTDYGNDFTWYYIGWEFQINESGSGDNSTYTCTITRDPGLDTRFTVDDQNIITDNVTELQWMVGPDTHINWNDANSWVNGLGGRWRMPSLPELHELYDAGVADNSWEICQTARNCGAVWSDKTEGTSSAWFYGFTYGGAESYCSRTQASIDWGSFCAFAVRSSEQNIPVIPVGTTIYSENFQSDPGFELAFDPLPGESYQWSGDYGGSYSMRMKEYPTTYRFSFTPDFQFIENESFHIGVDYLPVDDNGEWGMGLGLLALDGANWESQSVAIYYNGTNQRFHFHDGSGASITTGTLRYGVWYSLSIDYNAQMRTADFRVTERDTGNEFFTEQGVDFNPGAFDRFCLGSKSVNSDGNWISLYCDNILLELK